MKLIIAGSRHFISGSDVVDMAVRFIPELAQMVPSHAGYDPDKRITEVVSGCAAGIDRAGERWAEASFWSLDGDTPKIKRFAADWTKFGKGAGPYRNRQMADYADALLIIWDGESSGSKNMRQEMLARGKPVYEVIFRRVK